jgi:hypothetical protein
VIRLYSHGRFVTDLSLGEQLCIAAIYRKLCWHPLPDQPCWHSIFGGLFQTLSGSNNLETGIDINPVSICQNLLLSGVYMEGTILALNNMQFCNIGPVTVGGSGSGTLSVSNTLCTTFSGVCMGTGTISSGSNTFLGCAFPNFTDTGSPVNIYLNCDLSTVVISHRGI